MGCILLLELQTRNPVIYYLGDGAPAGLTVLFELGAETWFLNSTWRIKELAKAYGSLELEGIYRSLL